MKYGYYKRNDMNKTHSHVLKHSSAYLYYINVKVHETY